MSPTSTRQSYRRWVWLVACAIVFGAMMATREEFVSFWARAAIAGVAMGFFAFSFALSTRN